MLGRIGRPNQRIGPHLDRLGKFLQVLGDVEQIVEKLIDVFRVHVERLVELPGQFGQGLQRAPEFESIALRTSGSVSPIVESMCANTSFAWPEVFRKSAISGPNFSLKSFTC